MRIGIGLAITQLQNASGVAAPPIPGSYLAYYEALRDTTLSGSPASNYGKVDTWADLSPNGHDLIQATDANRPKFRSFGRGAVYTDSTDSMYHATAEIDKRSFSFFALADLTRYSTRVTETHVLFRCSAGSLKVVITGDYGTDARLVWEDTSTHTTTIPVPSSLNLIGVVLGSGGVTVYVNDQSASYSALTAGTINDGFSVMGYSGSNGWQGGVEAIVLYDVALDAGQKSQLDTWAIARGARYPSQLSKVFAVHGDSIADHDGSEDLLGFAAQVTQEGAARYQIAYPANTWDTVGNTITKVTQLYDPAKRCVAWLNAGINDIGTLGNTDAQAIAKAQQWLSHLREVGFLVICNQLADAGTLSGGQQTYRAAYNSTLAGLSTRSYANHVIAVPTELQDYTDSTYFSDSIHWTHAGHAAMAAAGQSALTSLLAEPVSSLKLNVDLDGDTLDSTVYQRDFVEINSPTYASGLNGKQCLVTAATGGKYARYRATGLHTLKFYPLTVMMWIKTTATAWNAFLLGHSSFTGLTLHMLENTGRFRAQLSAAGGAVAVALSTQVVNDGVWHAVAASFDADGVKVYTSPDSDAANLSLTGSAAWSGTPGPHNASGDYLNFGCDNNSGTGVNDASFQGLRIWSEARTLSQLQAETP